VLRAGPGGDRGARRLGEDAGARRSVEVRRDRITYILRLFPACAQRFHESFPRPPGHFWCATPSCARKHHSFGASRKVERGPERLILGDTQRHLLRAVRSDDIAHPFVELVELARLVSVRRRRVGQLRNDATGIDYRKSDQEPTVIDLHVRPDSTHFQP
jgi:hypothetical protein